MTGFFFLTIVTGKPIGPEDESSMRSWISGVWDWYKLSGKSKAKCSTGLERPRGEAVPGAQDGLLDASGLRALAGVENVFKAVWTERSPGNLFKISEWAGIYKICLAILLEIHCRAEMDPQDGKSSREQETASFCLCFKTDPPRLEADRRSKSKQSPGNSSEIDAILD